MTEIKLSCVKNKISETADGGFRITLDADRKQLLEVAKLLAVDQTNLLSITITYA